MIQDTFKRRSRFRRQPTGRAVRLRERDLNILKLLYRYRYLDSRQLIGFIRPKSEKRFIERLGQLFHDAHLINRPFAEQKRFSARYRPAIYELTTAGMETLVTSGCLMSKRAVPFAGYNIDCKASYSTQFEHAVETVRLVASVELLHEMKLNQHFIPEEALLEMIAKKSGQQISQLSLPWLLNAAEHTSLLKSNMRGDAIPDACFAIEHKAGQKSRYRFYAVEIERTNPLRRRTLKTPSFLKKLLTYRATLREKTYQSEYTLPNLYLIIGTTDETRLSAMFQMANEFLPEEMQTGRILFAPIKNAHSDIAMKVAQDWAKHFEL